MSSMASQISGLSTVCSAACSGADQRKHQSSASLAFVSGIHRWPVDSPHRASNTENDSVWWSLHGDRISTYRSPINHGNTGEWSWDIQSVHSDSRLKTQNILNSLSMASLTPIPHNSYGIKPTTAPLGLRKPHWLQVWLFWTSGVKNSTKMRPNDTRLERPRWKAFQDTRLTGQNMLIACQKWLFTLFNIHSPSVWWWETHTLDISSYNRHLW